MVVTCAQKFKLKKQPIRISHGSLQSTSSEWNVSDQASCLSQRKELFGLCEKRLLRRQARGRGEYYSSRVCFPIKDGNEAPFELAYKLSILWMRAILDAFAIDSRQAI